MATITNVSEAQAAVAQILIEGEGIGADPVSNDAHYQGGVCPAGLEQLRNGKIRMHSEDDYGPRFELRNTITYHPLNQQGIFMPICPFIFAVESSNGQIVIQRDDPLDLSNPARQVWEMKTETYLRRCPKVFYGVSDEAMQAIGVSSDQPASFQSFFQARKDWLLLQRVQALSELEREALTTRIYAIDNDIENPRMITRLGLLAQWEHTIRGHRIEIQGENLLGGVIDRTSDWMVRYWMGGTTEILCAVICGEA
ncbi:MAG: hypothetical protein JWN14_4800 [Chthonomonadales bacterium]|nr:hypothetical protein [Chthonomonadales bacterium]